jgi:hypothetical protein
LDLPNRSASVGEAPGGRVALDFRKCFLDGALKIKQPLVRKVCRDKIIDVLLQIEFSQGMNF